MSQMRQSSSVSELSTASFPPMAGTNIGLPAWASTQQHQQTDYQNRKAAVFWDFENCPPPSGMPGYVVVENIRNVIHHFGHVVLFKAYLEINDTTGPNGSKKSLRSELQSSGVSLTDCPHNGRKDAADKMLMVDMLAFAIDNEPPATIVLISGDKDFVYALSTLRNRRYTIVLIVPSKGAPIILRSQANTILEWRYDVLNQDVWNQQQEQVLRATSSLPSSASTGSSGSSPGSNPVQALSHMLGIASATPSSEQDVSGTATTVTSTLTTPEAQTQALDEKSRRIRSPLHKELRVSVSSSKTAADPGLQPPRLEGKY